MKIKPSIMLATALVSSSFVLPAHAQTAGQKEPPNAVYSADLQPMNATLTGHETTGKATFAINGDQLTITVNVNNAAPDITHWQHFHGFKANTAASCATQTADTNGDSVIDLIETESASGTTMVPFDNSPSAMDVAHGVYPKASAKGSYEYRKVVSLKALTAAFATAFDGHLISINVLC